MKNRELKAIIKMLKSKDLQFRDSLQYAYIDNHCNLWASDGYVCFKKYVGSVPYETQPEMFDTYYLHYSELEKFSKTASSKEEFNQTSIIRYNMNTKEIPYPDLDKLVLGFEKEEEKTSIKLNPKFLKQAIDSLGEDYVNLIIKKDCLIIEQNHDKTIVMGLK